MTPPVRRARARQAAHADHPLAWLIMACTLVGMLLAAADQTIVSAAMPRIVADLAGFTQYAWLTAAYLLGATVTMPLYGKLADLYDAKWVFLTGLLLFVAASALCGVAPSITQLMAFRGLQGMGAGALIPVGVVILSAFVTPARRAGMQGSAGGIFLLATVAGPIVGGWLTDHGTWRWIFYINVPLGLAVAAALVLLLPRLRLRRRQVRIDYLGAALLALGVVPLLLVASVPARERPALGTAWTEPLLAAGVVVLALFVLHELRHAEPILDPRLLTMRLFAGAAGTITLLSAITFAGLIYIPLYVQGVLGHSATRGGLVLAPLMLSSVSGRLVINWLRLHHGRIRLIALACLALVVAGALVLFLLSRSSSGVQIVLAMVLLGTGLGAGNMLLFAVALSPFMPRQFGQATGTLLFVRSFGGAIIVGALGNVLASGFATSMATDLPRRFRWLLHTRFATAFDNPRLWLTHLDNAASGRHPLLHAIVARAMREALVAGLHDVFAVALAMAILAFATLWLLPLRMTSQAEDEAAVVAGSGVAAAGTLAVLQEEPSTVPSMRQAGTVWDLMCHIVYWRHGAVQFRAPGDLTLHAFNRFEEAVDLPGSLRDPMLAAAFERAWARARARTALDRYRAESVAALLGQVHGLEGDIAVCGGMGDGLAVVLALLVRELALPKKVYFYHVLQPAANYLDGMLVPQPGPLPDSLRAIGQEQRFCLVHVDSDTYAGTKVCLAHLLPHASEGAAIVIGHYHNSRDGARRATQELLARYHARLHAGPLPQAHFFATRAVHDVACTSTPPDADWSGLRANAPYRDFLRWIATEIAGCVAGTEGSATDRHIARSVARLTLRDDPAACIERFVDALY